MRLQRLFVSTLAAILLVAGYVPARSALADADQEALDEALRKQQELSQRIKNAQSELERVFFSAEQIAVQLRIVEQELAVARAQVAVLTDQLIDAERQLDRAEHERDQAEERWRGRQGLLATRLRAVHETPSVSYLSVLMGSDTFGDFISRLDLMKAVVQKDADIVHGVRRDKQLMEQREQEATVRRDQVQGLQEQSVHYAQQVEAKQQQAQMTSQALQKQRLELQAQMRLYEEQSKQVEDSIWELQQRLARKAGRFEPTAPLRGKLVLTSSFGPRFIFGSWSNHGGIDLAANWGDPVLAVESGTVIHAAYDDLYGHRIVLDHGGGISTWYGHNQELLVDVGDEVRQGQIIAKAGSTGLSTGPHLHLEIRINGERVDPLEYIKL